MNSKTLILICFLALNFNIYGQVNKMSIDLDSAIRVTSVIETFEIQNHKIDTCDTGLGWTSICLIDGKPVFGTDHGMPRNQLLKLTLNYHGVDIPLNVDFMYNPNWNNAISKKQFTIIKCEVGYILSGIFSDGAGTYMVQWKIINGKSYRLIITNDETYMFK